MYINDKTYFLEIICNWSGKSRKQLLELQNIRYAQLVPRKKMSEWVRRKWAILKEELYVWGLPLSNQYDTLCKYSLMLCEVFYTNPLPPNLTLIVLRTEHLSHHVITCVNTFLPMDCMWSLWRGPVMWLCVKYSLKALFLLSSYTIFMWGLRQIDKSCPQLESSLYNKFFREKL